MRSEPSPKHRARRRRRITAVAAGIVLLAAPTFFGLFPEALRWALWVRVAIGAAWVLVAFFGVVASVHRDQASEVDLTQRLHRRTERTDLAMNLILDDLLRPGARLPDVYHCTVYVYDDLTKRLIPAYPKEPADSFALRCFEPGKGAAGYVFKLAQEGDRNATVVVTDDAVSDGTHGLTPGQQQFYAGFRALPPCLSGLT